MKSTEVYREARMVLGPWCKSQGFKRTQGGMLGWQKQVEQKWLTFWLQCSQHGWDTYAGSEFVVEFQLSANSCVGDGGPECFRHRLPFFLHQEELEEVRQIQNDVIGALPRPPADYFVLQMSPDVVNWYLANFAPVERSFVQTDDIWLRYHQPHHVRRWSAFLLQVLPGITTVLTAQAV
jgi:hypothetical protein